MRHDYNLPPEWNSMSDIEKSRWMTQDRCKRMYSNIPGASTSSRNRTSLNRIRRRLKAKGFVDLEKYR